MYLEFLAPSNILSTLLQTEKSKYKHVLLNYLIIADLCVGVHKITQWVLKKFLYICLNHFYDLQTCTIQSHTQITLNLYT